MTGKKHSIIREAVSKSTLAHDEREELLENLSMLDDEDLEDIAAAFVESPGFISFFYGNIKAKEHSMMNGGEGWERIIEDESAYLEGMACCE